MAYLDKKSGHAENPTSSNYPHLFHGGTEVSLTFYYINWDRSNPPCLKDVELILN